MIKGKVIVEKKEFEPIKLEITLETLNDLETFLAHMNRSHNDLKGLSNNGYTAHDTVAWRTSGCDALAKLFIKYKGE